MKFARLVPIVVLSLIVVLLLADPVSAQRGAEAPLYELVHDGLTRTYRLYVPADFTPDGPVPLLFALHGGGGDSRSMERLTERGFNRLADEYGFLVVYPDGLNHAWNDGRLVTGQASDADDVGFLLALLDHLAAAYPVDRARLYATGISNGGAMSFRLACNAADVFAAVAPVAMTMPAELTEHCTPAQPVPVLMIAGTDDPLVPYDGGDIRLWFFRTRGAVLPAEESAAWWGAVNGCTQVEHGSTPQDDVPDDSTRVEQTVYHACQEEGGVTLLSVVGGGHTWPGGWQYLWPSIVGSTSREFDANAVIWDFFTAQ